MLCVAMYVRGADNTALPGSTLRIKPLHMVRIRWSMRIVSTGTTTPDSARSSTCQERAPASCVRLLAALLQPSDACSLAAAWPAAHWCRNARV